MDNLSDHDAATLGRAYPILEFFSYAHLPERLQVVSKPFTELAFEVVSRETSHPAEVAAGLRKLLEAKDCIVRSVLPLR